MKLACHGRWALNRGGLLLLTPRSIYNQRIADSGIRRRFLGATVTTTKRTHRFHLRHQPVSSLRTFTTRDEKFSNSNGKSPRYTVEARTQLDLMSMKLRQKIKTDMEFMTRQRIVEMMLREHQQRRHLSSSSSPPPPPSSQEGINEAAKGGSSGNNNQFPTRQQRKRGRPRIKVPHYGPEADKAIHNLQNARKEQARAKTAANVQRALTGNCVICVAKLGAWLSSGSSSMMSEFVHSVVDCGNQSLLLMGLRDSTNAADKLHPYGYGKSIYFWALVSALGTFFLGAGVSMSHAVAELSNPSLQQINTEVWSVLALSFTVDGYVLYKTVDEVRKSKPANKKLLDHIYSLRDPATLAVLLEDGAACLGIVIAIAGISASHVTAMPIFDGIAGVGISCLLGSMGLALVKVNHRFLLGSGIDKEMTDRIEQIIRSRRSIDNVYSIQSQWTGPETFSFKAEVDFDGTYLAAQLMPRYQGEFQNAREDLDKELEVLLCWYAEDVMRAVEREIRHIEAMIRQKYPGAEYIELEPMGKDSDKFAIDDSFEEKLFVVEKEEMQRLIRVLYEKDEAKRAAKREMESQATADPRRLPEATTSTSSPDPSGAAKTGPPSRS